MYRGTTVATWMPNKLHAFFWTCIWRFYCISLLLFVCITFYCLRSVSHRSLASRHVFEHGMSLLNGVYVDPHRKEPPTKTIPLYSLSVLDPHLSRCLSATNCLYCSRSHWELARVKLELQVAISTQGKDTGDYWNKHVRFMKSYGYFSFCS